MKRTQEGKAKSPRGRPTKLDVTPEITQRVCQSLLACSKYQTAANLAGIGVRTFERWRRLGKENPDSPYGEFWRATTAAEAEAQEGLSAAATLASRKDGKLALELLRARWPMLWPKTVKHELNGQLKEKVTIRVEDVARELKRMVEGSDD